MQKQLCVLASLFRMQILQNSSISFVQLIFWVLQCHNSGPLYRHTNQSVTAGKTELRRSVGAELCAINSNNNVTIQIAFSMINYHDYSLGHLNCILCAWEFFVCTYNKTLNDIRNFVWYHRVNLEQVALLTTKIQQSLDHSSHSQWQQWSAELRGFT